MIKQAWDYKSTVVKNLSNIGGSNNSQGYGESYYKVIDKNVLASLLSELHVLNMGINGVVVEGDYININIHRLNSSAEVHSTFEVLDLVVNAPMDFSIAFSYSLKPITCIFTSKYNSDSIIVHYPEGDIIDKYFYEIVRGEEIRLGRPLTEEEKTTIREVGYEEFKTYVYKAITPISKVEFEAFITNK